MDSIVIKNGNVYDPVLNRFVKKDIAVNEGVITEEPGRDAVIVDAAGCVVTTGLIDYHIHVYNGGTEGGIPADMGCLPNGVTACVDGGSAGCGNYTSFYQQEIQRSCVTVKAMLNISTTGLIGPQPEDIRPQAIEQDRICRLIRTHPEIIALKVRASEGIMKKGPETIMAAMALAEKTGCNLVVHVTNPAIPMEEIAAFLRPGDVLCHMYQGYGDTILGNEWGMTGRTIKEGILAARKRGVIFDACNGRSNFSLKVASRSMKEGFLPDIISSDLNGSCYYKRPCVSLPFVMSKYLALGLTIEEILACVTMKPARLLGEERELASLAPGTAGDIAVLKVVEKRTIFDDCHGDTLEGNQMILPQMTIKGGKMVYCQADFA